MKRKYVIAGILICVIAAAAVCVCHKFGKPGPEQVSGKTEAEIAEMRESLLEKGLPSGYLDYLADPQLIDLYDSLKYTCVNVLGYTDYSNSLLGADTPSGMIPAENFQMSLMVLGIKENPQDKEYSEIQLEVNYEWLDMPSRRNSDEISISWGSPDCDFPIASDSFEQTDYYYNGSSWIANYTSGRAAAMDFRGLAYYAELHHRGSGLRGSARLRIDAEDAKEDRNGEGSEPVLQVLINYTHDKTPVLQLGSFFGLGWSDSSELYEMAALKMSLDLKK